MKRIIRDRYLTPEEVAKYKRIRELVEQDLPELIARHHEHMAKIKYTPWRISLICQPPNIGSRWYRGNFTLGLAVDSHPRYIHVILCLIVVEIGLGWSRQAVIEDA